MYVITSKLNGKRVGLAQTNYDDWFWSEELTEAAFFKKKSEARHIWITHRDFIPDTNKKVYIDQLVLEQVERLE